MERDVERRVSAAGPVYQVASTGPGDEETEFALENELREEIEGYWYEGVFTARDHPPSSECSQDTDVIMSESAWALLDDLPVEYELALDDLHAEELHLSVVEQIQDMEDFNRDLNLLMEREQSEWPEDMSRQYDESRQTAHRRQLILEIVRNFLRG